MLFRCARHMGLAQKLADAIQDVHRLLAEIEAADPGSNQHGALLNRLREAVADQRHAEQAFSEHIKEHKCAEWSLAARG
jgi:hypothetical protein